MAQHHHGTGKRKHLKPWPGSCAIAVGVAWLLVTTGCVHTRAFTDAHGHVIPGRIATRETVTIGDLRQRIWFRGVNTASPALILLHGGPGAREAALFRHDNAAL